VRHFHLIKSPAICSGFATRFSADTFRAQVNNMQIKEVLSAPRSPWQRAYVERVIGSMRRECLDHVILRGSLLASNPVFLLLLLSPNESASFLGQGRAGASADPATGAGTSG